MNNNSFEIRNTIPISLGNMTKINPFNKRKDFNTLNNNSTKTKNIICNTTREFGKEIIVSSNLTTLNNKGDFNNRKSLIPCGPKMKKENKINKYKNYVKIAIHKGKKENSKSLNKKPNSIGKNVNFKDSKKQIKKVSCFSKKTGKNKSVKSKLSSNRTINIGDDIVIKDENKNPNISALHSSNINKISNKIKINTNKEDEDIEMKIENNFISKIKVNKVINLQNADEYFDDICYELFKNEDQYLVDPQYMSNQTDINHKMRAILIDWLIDVHLKYKLLPQTLYITIHLIDRYLSKNNTNRAKLQLVGITAMFIACKYEEIYPPYLKDFVYITDGAYVKSEVLNMEYKMLKCLDFNITFPTHWSIFEIYRKKLELDEKAFKLAWFLMELNLINYRSLKFKKSVLAASAILIASKTLGIYRNNWFNKNINIEENQLKECCREIYDFYLYNSTHSLQAIRKKFSSIKYDEVAKIKIC